jgi:hypothetical protein
MTDRPSTHLTIFILYISLSTLGDKLQHVFDVLHLEHEFLVLSAYGRNGTLYKACMHCRTMLYHYQVYDY